MQQPAQNAPVIPQDRPDYETEILQLITTERSPKKLREELAKYHVSSIAETFTRIEPELRLKLLKLLDAPTLAQIIDYLDVEEQTEYLNEINIKKAISILNEMEPQYVAVILKNMSKQKREIIIELLDPELRSNLTKIYSYDNDEIGSRMSTDFIKIDKNAPVKEAMRSMTEQVRELDTDNISILYVTDENGQYYGAIKIQDLFAARAGSSLEDIISINFPFVYGNELIADSMEDLKDYAEDSIPVLRRDNTLEGIITRQNLLELLDQELSEDYAKLGGLTSQEDLEESLFHSLQKRTPWLLLLLFLSLGVSTVVSMFEGVVAKLSVAVVFQSLVLDMAGNVGTQSLAVSIRVLADPDLTIKERMFLIFKETRTGFANGLVIGSGSALVLGIFVHYAFGYSWINAYAIALCVGLAMLVSMVISSLSGTAIPALFQRLGIDPAAASGPLITTLNDLIGVTTYYSLVWVLLIQMLKL